MGQRSQIYVRYNKNLIIANYYQWNFAERMISRARTILERLLYQDEYLHYYFNSKHEIEKISRLIDTNFDMRDIVMSSNIIKEYKENKNSFLDWNRSFNEEVFYQDNNDGCLFIDITGNKEDGHKIKYAFTEDLNYEKTLDAVQYMNWDISYSNPDHSQRWIKYIKKYYKDNADKIIEYTTENLDFIKSNFEVMTVEELKDFIGSKYDDDGNYIGEKDIKIA